MGEAKLNCQWQFSFAERPAMDGRAGQYPPWKVACLKIYLIWVAPRAVH